MNIWQVQLVSKVTVDDPPQFPCWVFLPECQEWQWFTETIETDYCVAVFSHWSKGGRPEAPKGRP